MEMPTRIPDPANASSPTFADVVARHAPLLGALFFALLLILINFLPHQWPVVDICDDVLVLCCLLSSLRMAVQQPEARSQWLLLSANFLLLILCAPLYLAQDFWGAHTDAIANLITSLSIMPLVLISSLQPGRRSRGLVRFSIFALAAGICILLTEIILTMLPLGGADATPHDQLFLANLFCGFNLYITIAATLRGLGTESPEQRRFFSIFALYAWLGTLLFTVYNYGNMVQFLPLPDWMGAFVLLPRLLMLIFIWHPVPRWLRFGLPSATMVRFVRTGSPIFLMLVMLLLGILIAHRHFYLGATAILASVLFYSVLNVTSLSRGLEAEENLLAAKQNLETLIGVDPLTGVANRRAFDERIHHECHFASFYGRPLSLLMIDVDLFKQLNDTNGHLVGDDYLMRIARTLKSALPRMNDFLARYGGEEFAVLLPSATNEGAQIVAERLHTAISALALPHAASPTGSITISIGIASCHQTPYPSPVSLIYDADRALYRAKTEGRNRTEALR